MEEQAPGQIVGVWGESFGGATAGLALGYEDVDEKVDFLILDCPISSMEWMIEQEMKSMDVGIPLSYMTFWQYRKQDKIGLFLSGCRRGKSNENVKTGLIINSK